MVFRRVLLAASNSERVESVVRTAGVTRRLMSRYVAGNSPEDAASVAARLVADGLPVTLDHLNEEIRNADQAARAVTSSLAALDGLARRGLAKEADLSVRLSAMGLHVDEQLAKENAARVCRAAARVGATVTLEMDDAALTRPALDVHAALRKEHPSTGVAVRSCLRQAEEHCARLASARVRLCRGGSAGPAWAVYHETRDIDRSFVRCLRVLMAGQGYPMVATHDRRLIEVASALAVLNEREHGGFEFQMSYGVGSPARARLVETGARVRVRVPYGVDWYGHLARRLAERSANVALLTRSLVGR